MARAPPCQTSDLCEPVSTVISSSSRNWLRSTAISSSELALGAARFSVRSTSRTPPPVRRTLMASTSGVIRRCRVCRLCWSRCLCLCRGSPELRKLSWVIVPRTSRYRLPAVWTLVSSPVLTPNLSPDARLLWLPTLPEPALARRPHSLSRLAQRCRISCSCSSSSTTASSMCSLSRALASSRSACAASSSTCRRRSLANSSSQRSFSRAAASSRSAFPVSSSLRSNCTVPRSLSSWCASPSRSASAAAKRRCMASSAWSVSNRIASRARSSSCSAFTASSSPRRRRPASRSCSRVASSSARSACAEFKRFRRSCMPRCSVSA
mmetsp:Transcript_69356/g.191896  ORF Transcript_69356/g.191896 Transcript_69356/m.191896 type:complete len:323 (-) Transcript_69356:368-1336(-)